MSSHPVSVDGVSPRRLLYLARVVDLVVGCATDGTLDFRPGDVNVGLFESVEQSWDSTNGFIRASV